MSLRVKPPSNGNRHVLLPTWLGLDGSPDAGRDGALLVIMGRRGLNARSWRLYLDFGDDLFAPLSVQAAGRALRQPGAQIALAYLAVLQACDTEIPPPPALIRCLTSSHSLPLEVSQAALLMTAWKEYLRIEYAGADTSAWLMNEAAPLLRWAIEERDPARIKGRRKLSWTVLRKRWFEALRERALPAWPAAWPTPCGYLSLSPGWLWVPLQSAEALEDEGQAMSHCVGQYADECAAGDYRVYSLRSLPRRERVGTLGVERTEHGWGVDQFKGPANEEFSEDAGAWLAVKALLTRLNARRPSINDLLDDRRWRDEAGLHRALRDPLH